MSLTPPPSMTTIAEQVVALSDAVLALHIQSNVIRIQVAILPSIQKSISALASIHNQLHSLATRMDAMLTHLNPKGSDVKLNEEQSVKQPAISSVEETIRTSFPVSPDAGILQLSSHDIPNQVVVLPTMRASRVANKPPQTPFSCLQDIEFEFQKLPAVGPVKVYVEFPLPYDTISAAKQSTDVILGDSKHSTNIGISCHSMHTRRAHLGHKKDWRKKRKPVTRICVYGGNVTWRALRFKTGNYSWGSEFVHQETHILAMVYNASNIDPARRFATRKFVYFILHYSPLLLSPTCFRPSHMACRIFAVASEIDIRPSSRTHQTLHGSCFHPSHNAPPISTLTLPWVKNLNKEPAWIPRISAPHRDDTGEDQHAISTLHPSLLTPRVPTTL